MSGTGKGHEIIDIKLCDLKAILFRTSNTPQQKYLSCCLIIEAIYFRLSCEITEDYAFNNINMLWQARALPRLYLADSGSEIPSN